jgi:hypothetical protein
MANYDNISRVKKYAFFLHIFNIKIDEFDNKCTTNVPLSGDSNLAGSPNNRQNI